MAEKQETVVQLLDMALSTGATLAGIANVSEIRQAAAVRTYPVGDEWLPDGRSVLVLALAHPTDQPELDWWGTESGTLGNYQLKRICEKCKYLLAREFNIKANILTYQPGRMGLFLKDAAVLAGLGCIGDNNLLLTPGFGPVLRLRALLLDAELPGSAAEHASPCAACEHPCWKACPQNAFEGGSYNRLSCRAQMGKDEFNRTAVETKERGWVTYVKYCRACELACPMGRTGFDAGG